jgi:hypothetical protein
MKGLAAFGVVYEACFETIALLHVAEQLVLQ